MARVRVNKGAEDIVNMLANIDKNANAAAKRATYEGAKVLADAIRKSAKALPEERFRFLKDGEQFSVVAKEDKEDLLNSLGIDQIERDEDGVRTVIGFAGYGRHKTKKYLRGLPMPLLARAIESGSSVRRAHPFVRPTVSEKRKEAKAAMIDEGNRMIREMTERG